VSCFTISGAKNTAQELPCGTDLNGLYAKTTHICGGQLTYQKGGTDGPVLYEGEAYFQRLGQRGKFTRQGSGMLAQATPSRAAERITTTSQRNPGAGAGLRLARTSPRARMAPPAPAAAGGGSRRRTAQWSTTLRASTV
jgi:hypothetical protein